MAHIRNLALFYVVMTIVMTRIGTTGYIFTNAHHIIRPSPAPSWRAVVVMMATAADIQQNSLIMLHHLKSLCL